MLLAPWCPKTRVSLRAFDPGPQKNKERIFWHFGPWKSKGLAVVMRVRLLLFSFRFHYNWPGVRALADTLSSLCRPSAPK